MLFDGAVEIWCRSRGADEAVMPSRAKKNDVTRHGVGSAPDPVADADAFIASVSAKASRNKFRSRAYVYMTALTTTAIPSVVAIAPTPIWLKLVTLVLSLFLVVSSLALELNRPHERWGLYRRYQRLLEVERSHHRYGLGDYKGLTPEDRSALLAERLTVLQNDLHGDWEKLMPSSADVVTTARNPGASRGR
jgi:hypothetical protein